MALFWVRATFVIEKELIKGSSNSNFIRNVFVNEFPRLAAVFEVLFGRIRKHILQPLSQSLLEPTQSAPAFGPQSEVRERVCVRV
jgi:hypothetical protein